MENWPPVNPGLTSYSRPSAVQPLGSTSIIGFDDSKFFSLDISNDLKRNDREVIEKNKTVTGEERNIIAETGEEQYYSTVKQPILDTSGNVVGMFGVSSDITPLKKMGIELQAFNEDLRGRVEAEVQKRKDHEQLLIQQSKMAAMGEMISAIAHQWRQPLNALGLNIQDLQDAQNYGELDERYLKEAVKRSMEQIKFMSKTIDDFRDFFKPKRDREPFDLYHTIEETTNLISAQMRHHDIKVEVQTDPTCKIDGQCRLIGYPGEIKQVVLNFLSNAKDAILEREQKCQGIIRIDLAKSEEGLRVSVTDNGRGISDKHLHRIFEPYFTTKEEGKGTGVGLYMTKIIVEEHMKGKIEVATKNGKTCFSAVFPTEVVSE